ncbi:poly-beta-1,6-N-acetyl-D-glucosamine biosynthesis protein PgaD [Acinetobacter sp. ANC 4635]|uniref:poly-beta-1,6-N-acetyl-D-glucosamine biosynthesis protein PgaD n=1 Tax=Acinetobacter sp. ANC 4635 TaxID=2529846 RepID=UPI0010398C9A|nr:poly-beta-1,6-N-acetyl-D-glucosamine biosynthesis protein PgaD [Acinetobacter sp. ANC 4635]TCB32076.1 poly-beta-1,6-N-acetyl-D-glucosamine biosynthesis protein PgaD [Acinetobacter sp. ANC 4635]
MNNQVINYQIIEDESKLDLPEYIDNPHYVKNKTAGYLLQLIGWVLFILIIFPLITLFLWYFEFKLVKKYIFNDAMYAQLTSLMHIGIGILIFSLLLILWASYNWVRFNNKERRKKSQNTPIDEFAKDFLLTGDDLVKLQQGSNIVLHYDEDGLLEYYDVVK